MAIRQRWLARKIGLAGWVVAIAVAWGGCATIESIFSPPPPPKVPISPPSPLPPKKEPAPPPAKREPEPPPPPRKDPEAPPAKKEAPPPPTKAPTPAPAPPAPPVKKEPAPPPAKREPEPPPPPKKEPEIPPEKKESEMPPVLAPQVGKGDEEQLKRTAGSRIQRTEQLIGQLEGKSLTTEQQERLMTVRSLLGNAKDAVAAQDLAKASNLAEKARLLAEELSQSVK